MLRRWSLVVSVRLVAAGDLDREVGVGGLAAARGVDRDRIVAGRGPVGGLGGDRDRAALLPALTTTLAACAVVPTWAVTVQPAGPVAVTLNGRSSGVSLVSVRLNEKVASEAPLSCGVSVVRVTSPAALGATRMSTGSVVDAPGDRAAHVDPLRPRGRVGWDRHVERDLGRGRCRRDSTPSMVKPPPRRTAVQPSGRCRPRGRRGRAWPS